MLWFAVCFDYCLLLVLFVFNSVGIAAVTGFRRWFVINAVSVV